MKDTGGPAFPLNIPEKWFEGMDLRDYFAAQAMLICPIRSQQEAAQWCYRMADEMLKAKKL